MRVLSFLIFYVLHFTTFYAQENFDRPDEPYRPQFHFTPKEKWMNDPNGMVYFKKQYHLFYQYHPGSSVWGPMHWGHATSKDLVHWQRRSVKLFPDSIGTIFSGSAVVDKNNTAGFGKNAMVAIFTQHSHAGENAGRNDFQNQSIAYSLDNGETWIKYSGNPVLKNPGIKDFRDPKVSWYEPTKKWIMTLAVLNKVSFYSSPDFKNWTLESSFGENAGAHGGVWECPDLFSMEQGGRQWWVLLVSLNPGGPNGGSATQYFIGDFDGKNFTTTDTATRWIDYGPDNYAGVTWSNTGKKKLFIGWMSNWSYATTVPTETWRSAMTMTRELKLVKENDRLLLASSMPKTFKKIITKPVKTGHLHLDEAFDVTGITGGVTAPAMINLTMDAENDFVITMNNTAGDELLIGYDKKKNRYYLDRSRSGKTNFSKAFAAVHTAPRLSGKPQIKLILLIDAASIEVFADGGLTVMTQIFFPNKPFDKIFISSPDHAMIRKLEFARIENIWK